MNTSSLTKELQNRFNYLQDYRKNKVDFEGYENTLYGKFVDYCDHNVANVKDLTHYIRYCETFKRIEPHIDKSMHIAEAGGASLIVQFLIDYGFNCTVLEGDFRYEIISPNNSYDVLLSLETLEHIKDQESNLIRDVAVFNFSGMKCYLAEMARVLTKNGLLFLTTPNANSFRVLYHWLNFRPPLMTHVHVRELTKSELWDLCQAHFDVMEFTDMFCFGPIESKVLEPFHKAVENLGGSTENRGDDFFLMLRNKV